MPKESLAKGWFRPLLKNQGLLWRMCFRRMGRHQGGIVSSALCYQTVFAIVPTIVLVFLVIKAGGMLENGKQGLHQMLQEAGWPLL